MGPKTTPSLIPPPLAWDEIDTPWEIGLNLVEVEVKDELGNKVK